MKPIVMSGLREDSRRRRKKPGGEEATRAVIRRGKRYVLDSFFTGGLRCANDYFRVCKSPSRPIRITRVMKNICENFAARNSPHARRRIFELFTRNRMRTAVVNPIFFRHVQLPPLRYLGIFREKIKSVDVRGRFDR